MRNAFTPPLLRKEPGTWHRGGPEAGREDDGLDGGGGGGGRLQLLHDEAARPAVGAQLLPVVVVEVLHPAAGKARLNLWAAWESVRTPSPGWVGMSPLLYKRE